VVELRRIINKITMTNKTLGIVIAIIVLVAIGVVGAMYIMNNPKNDNYTASNSDANQNQPAANQNNTQTPADQVPATPNPADTAPTAQTLNGCTRNFDANKLKTAKVDIANKFVTLNVNNFGNIKIQLYDKDAPKTVENFLRLVNSGYYDCLTFHRVAKGFVIQSGDPTGTGSGGDSAFGGRFADELNKETPSYKTGYVKGVLAMANAGPNTNTSQFFILIGDATAMLPHSYTIFGKVVAGENVTDKIGQVDITPQMGPTDGAPKTPVVIEKATISSK
jgi:cyclophilin family peptidyl-prolyl cis-trans isomerase